MCVRGYPWHRRGLHRRREYGQVNSQREDGNRHAAGAMMKTWVRAGISTAAWGFFSLNTIIDHRRRGERAYALQEVARVLTCVEANEVVPA
jgi:hypothetical protein